MLSIQRQMLLLNYGIGLFFYILLSAIRETTEVETTNGGLENLYTVSYTKLQNDLIKNISKLRRPVKNLTDAVGVEVAVWISHLSINQREQTVKLGGYLYMRWESQLDAWDPRAYGNLIETDIMQWNVWVPEMHIANSVEGEGRNYEFDRNSRVQIHSIYNDDAPSTANLLIQQAFTTTIGCKFDYSAYPHDVQKCPLVLYPSQRMSAVELSNISSDISMRDFYRVGWNTPDKHVSDWKLTATEHQLRYYSWQGKELPARPNDSESRDNTWTVYQLWFEIHRFTPYFGLTVVLPAVISFAVVIFSALLKSPNSAIYFLITNLFIISIYFEGLYTELPPPTGGLPRIVYYISILLMATTASVIYQFLLNYIVNNDKEAPKFLSMLNRFTTLFPIMLRNRAKDKEPNGLRSNITLSDSVRWKQVADVSRIVFIAVLLLVFFFSTLFLAA